MEIEFTEGRKGYYDMIWGTMKGFKSYTINELETDDEKIIVDIIVKFIAGIEQLKKRVQ
jgi:hypothetical protein